MSMTKSMPSLLVLLISSLAAINQLTINAQSLQSDWFLDRNEMFKRWFQNKPMVQRRTLSSALDSLRSTNQFKGCIDPSEPFQCPRSQRCIALQFICDGNPGDCPGNFDENEETCIAAKRPAKENIEKFFQAEFALHGLKLFRYVFGEFIAKNVEQNHEFWFDTLASALSVSKTIRLFGDKVQMPQSDLIHFQNVLQMIHEGRLEEIPTFLQEAVNQGLASLIEKLYESSFMEQTVE